jgi:hypothetical protein
LGAQLAIEIIRDGGAHYRRALRIAEREIDMFPDIWTQTDVTAYCMTAWLLHRAGATDSEIAAWMGETVAIIGVVIEHFSAQMSRGTREARDAQSRICLLERLMGTIVDARIVDGDRSRVECEIIAFPRRARLRAVAVGGDVA